MVRKVGAVAPRAHSASRSVVKRLDGVEVGAKLESRHPPKAGPSQAEIAFAVRITSGRTVWRQKERVASCVVGIGVVAGNAEQHRRHAERERDLAGGDVLGLDEIHVLRREPSTSSRARLRAAAAGRRCARPGSPAPARPSAARTARASDCPSLALIDQRAGGPRRIVEQRLVPGAAALWMSMRRPPPPRSGSCRSGR